MCPLSPSPLPPHPGIHGGSDAAPGLLGAAQLQLKAAKNTLRVFTAPAGVLRHQISFLTGAKLNQPHAREKFVNHCLDRRDVSPPWTLVGATPGPGTNGTHRLCSPAGAGGSCPAWGARGCAPTVGLSHHPPRSPRLPQLTAIWPGCIKGMEKPERNEVRAVTEARGQGKPAPALPSLAAGPQQSLTSPVGSGCGTSQNRVGPLGCSGPSAWPKASPGPDRGSRLLGGAGDRAGWTSHWRSRAGRLCHA